jgi:hypothetical protein
VAATRSRRRPGWILEKSGRESDPNGPLERAFARPRRGKAAPHACRKPNEFKRRPETDSNFDAGKILRGTFDRVAGR